MKTYVVPCIIGLLIDALRERAKETENDIDDRIADILAENKDEMCQAVINKI